jgi:peptide deformylase
VSLLDIHVLGAPVLRAETTPVTEVTEELQHLIDDMFETMHACEGIGLAAPQVGRLERLAVVEVDERPIVLINPEVISGEGSERAEEGCLSIPDVFGEVERSSRVMVRALDRHGQPFELEASGLLARAIQHEIDHLHGKLFIDYLSFLKKRAALSRWDSLREKYPQLMRKVTPLDAQRAASTERGARGQVEEEVL